MQETGPNQEAAKEIESTIFNLKESIAGVEGLMDKPLVKIEQGIVAMDQGFRSIVNSMGAGENMSEAIRKNLAGATIETIKMGGDAKSALNVQLDTLKVMGKNVTLSQNLTTELFAASQVSGRSIEELETGFLNAGMSLKDISKQMLVVRDVANSLGVNAKLVSDSVVKNLDKLNSYGFQGGVEGLARMAAKATALRVDMQSTFNVADKLMSPEGAIEMSAALQRLGATSTDLLDPLKLMDLAQNNVPELQKQLGEMFKQYTYFDEKTKTFQIMPGARRQLKEIAGELGMGIEEVQRMALGTADLDKKLSEISFSGFEVSEDTKEMVANMATMTDSGEYKIQTEEIGADGKPVSKTIQEVMEQFKGDEAGLKEYLTGLDKSKQPKTIEEIAQEQLDVLTGIRKASEALVASPGLAAGASKIGPQVLQSAKALAEKINEPLTEKLGPDSKGLTNTFDETAVKLEEAFKNLTSPEKGKKEEGGRQLLEAFGTLSKGMGKQIAEGVGDSLTGFSELFGIDIDAYKKQIEESFLTAKEKAEAEAAKLKDKVDEKLKGEKTEEDKTIFPDENKLIFPDSVNTQEIKTSSIIVEKPETEEETKLIFPDNVESKEIRAGKIIVEEGINLTAPTPTPTITPTNVTPEVGTKPTGEVKGETIANPFEDPQLLANVEKIKQLYEQGLVGEPLASAGNEVLFNQELPELTGELPEIKEVKTTEPETGFLEKFNNFVQELKIQPVEAAPTEEPKTDLLQGFESSLQKISEFKLPEIGLFGKPKTEEPKTDLLQGFESSLQKISDLKIGGLGEKPKIELGKPEGKTEEGLFDKKPSILGKFISEGKVETEEKPEEEKKGRFSKIKDAFVKSFIEPKAEEQTFVLPEEEYTPGEIGTEEGLTNLDKTATELGVNQEELKNIATQEIQPETELKVNTSEVENLNVKNLNIGPELTKLLGATKEVKEGEPVNVQVQKLIDEGIVGEPTVSTGKEVLFNQELPEATQEPTPAIDIESVLPEVTEELPEVQSGEPQTKGGFLDKIMSMGKPVESEEPSAYEGYKKLLEEISGAEIVGQGKEAFFLTPEMIEEGKKGSELIGPENNTFNNLETKKLEKTSEKLFDFKPSILGKYIAEQSEQPIEDLEKIESKGLIEDKGLAPIKPALASLPIPEKEEKQRLGERIKEGIGGLKEKLKGKQEEEKPITPIPETTKTFVARDAEGNIVGESIDRETARKMAGGRAITVEEETQTVTPTVPETPAVGVEKAAAEAEEKTPFKERLKDRFKKLIEEKPDESEAKITIEEPKEVKPTEETQKEESGYLKMLDENDKEADKFLTGKKTSPFGLDMSMFSQKLPAPPKASLEVEETKPVASNIENIFEDEEDFGPVEPVSEFAEDGTIKPFSGKPEEIKEPEETEIQKTIREAREKQLAFLEELRLKEQTPETPARGIEKLAGMGQKIGGLFGFGKEEPTITTPEVPYEEPEETFEGYGTLPEETQITPTETIEGGFETETPELIQEGIPEDLSQIALPSPIGAAPQGGYGETAAETKPGETVEKKMTVEGGSPIEVTVIHKFVNLPTTIDTNTLSNVLKSDNNIQQAIAKAVKDAALGLTS